MIIGMSNDHAATDLKFELKNYLESKGHTIINYGTDGKESYDYPKAAKALTDGIRSGECERGIAICGTGVGISIACNKAEGIRACCCSEPASARLTRLHNDANVICFGARIVGFEEAKMIVDTFIETEFTNDERHIRRISMISDLEK